MNADFYQRLYYGLGVEYFVIAQLFSMGYEAFKIPADFGFDIMVYNQRERSFQNNTNNNMQPRQKPKVIQVKSKLILPDDYCEKDTPAGKRKSVIKDFYLNISEKEKLLNEKNSYLICCFKEKNDIGFEIKGYFWLSNKHLKKLDEAGYIRNLENDTNKVFIRAKFITQAFLDERYKELLPKIKNSNLDEDTKNTLKWLIERTVNSINTNSSIYITLAREDRTPDEFRTNPFDVWSDPLPDKLYSLKNLDMEIQLTLR